MASLLKSQIFKHLSKFTKNLSPDKINLSTLKGEGELLNLELDENILMDLMDLPTWMCLTKAVCNKVSIKIQWTKLKSKPICLFLDEVVLEMETCNEPRPPNNPAHMASYRSGGKYGFVDRVIDGIYVHINAVMVKFISKRFTASLQLSRVKVHSVSPNWHPTEDLRLTMIKDVGLGEVVLFKEVDWQTTRIEANATDEQHATTPLRFIANQSKIRIAMKKSLNDCSLLTSRVMLLLDDLLWVLTTTQLKAAILYINSLKEMIEKSTQQSKKMAADKLQQIHADHAWVQQPQQQSQPRSQSNTASARIFTNYDILTTSYHLITSRIDLHLCDDSTPNPNANTKHNSQIEGGAMQITLFKLSMDYYPYHLADSELILTRGGERKQWYRYLDNLGSRNTWVRKLFEDFRKDVTKARETCCVPSPSQSPSHNPLNTKSSEKILHSDQAQQRIAADKSQSVPRLSPSHVPRPKSTKLMECCMVLKLEDFHIYRVSTADNKRNVPHKFLTSDKKLLHLPPDMSVIHLEYTDYFFTEGVDYPVPHSNLYVLINPIRLTVDFLTLLWINYFALNLSQNIDINIGDQTIEHIDIKVEAVMPRVIIPAKKKVESQPDRPEGLQIQISRLSATNTCVEDGILKKNLLETLQTYSKACLFSSTDYPNDNSCFLSIPKHFADHARSLNNPYITKYAKGLVDGHLPDHLATEEQNVISTLMKVNTLKLDSAYDVWGIGIDQLWLEFVGTPSCRTRPIPFVESFPLNLWFCKTRDTTSVENITSSVHISSVKSDSDMIQSSQTDSDRTTTTTKHLKQYCSDEDSEHDPSLVDCNLIHSNQSSKPTNCDNHEQKSGKNSSNEESCSFSHCRLADFYVVAKFVSKIRAQLNHFQYLFLLRMIESFSEFQIQLNADLVQYESSSRSLNIVFPLIIPDIEFAIVCPYVSELLQMTTPNDIISPVASSDKDLEFDDIDHEIVPDIESREVSISDSNTSLSQISTPISKSQSDSRIHLHNVDMMASISQEKLNLPSEETLQTSQSSDALSLSATESVVAYRASDGNVLSHSVVRDSGCSSETKSKATVKNINRAADQMKKSFTSAMTSFTDRLKAKDHNEELLSVPDDLETMSIRTDISDDEDFEFLAFEDEQPAFSHGSQFDTASSTGTDVQDDLSSLYAESSTTTKGKELISVIIYHVKGTELMLESIGQDILLRLQTAFFENLETGNIFMEEFSNKFISSKAGFFCSDEVPLSESAHFPIKMKYLFGPAAELEATKGEERGFLSVRVNSQKMEMNMSSTISIANFIEDEIIPDAVPMHITLTDLDLTLQEDRPPMNITSPGPVPVNLLFHKLVVTLGANGVFHFHGDSSSFHLRDPMLPSVDRLQAGIVTTQNGSLVRGTEDESTELLDLSISNASKFQALQTENTELKKCLNELIQLNKKQEDKIENLMQSVHLVSDIRTENNQLRQQIHKITNMSNGNVPQNSAADSESVKDFLEDENLKLQQKVTNLEDDLHSAVKEKDSLLATLRLLQDELLASEQHHLKESDPHRK